VNSKPKLTSMRGVDVDVDVVRGYVNFSCVLVSARGLLYSQVDFLKGAAYFHAFWHMHLICFFHPSSLPVSVYLGMPGHYCVQVLEYLYFDHI